MILNQRVYLDLWTIDNLLDGDVLPSKRKRKLCYCDDHVHLLWTAAGIRVFLGGLLWRHSWRLWWRGYLAVSLSGILLHTLSRYDLILPGNSRRITLSFCWKTLLTLYTQFSRRICIYTSSHFENKFFSFIFQNSNQSDTLFCEPMMVQQIWYSIFPWTSRL